MLLVCIVDDVRNLLDLVFVCSVCALHYGLRLWSRNPRVISEGICDEPVVTDFGGLLNIQSSTIRLVCNPSVVR